MKASLILAILCLTFFTGHSQFFIGLTPTEATKEVKLKFGINSVIKSYYSEAGDYFLHWEAQESNWAIGFKSNIASVLLLTPTSRNALNQTIEGFNQKYLIISNTEWKAYLNGRVYSIKLVYPKGGQNYIFIFQKSDS